LAAFLTILGSKMGATNELKNQSKTKPGFQTSLFYYSKTINFLILSKQSI
jgi:hypothetical protein